MRATCSNKSSENGVYVIGLAERVIVISKCRVVAASMWLCEVGLWILVNCILFTTQLQSKLTSRCKSIGPLVAANLPLESKLYSDCKTLNVKISKWE